MNSRPLCVYILTNKIHGTLYIGVTGDLPTRLLQHKNGTSDGFTKKYKIHKLIYYEAYDNPQEAILREKQLKAWKRQWKIELIQKENPHWRDMSSEFIER